MHDELPQQYRDHGFLFALVTVAAIAIGFTLLFRSAMQPMNDPQIGKPFPPIAADGWINGQAPTAEELRGQVLVVDAFAYWCGPCRMLTPTLIALHEKYKDRGVTFIGLTSEGSDGTSRQKTIQFVQRDKIPWRSGYAAIKTLSALEVETIPQIWVVDGQNRIVFHEVGLSENEGQILEQALLKALETSDVPVSK